MGYSTSPSAGSPGVALLLAILALFVVLVLGATAAILAVQEMRVVDARDAGVRARLAAESAASIATVDWRTSALTDLVPGEPPSTLGSGFLDAGVEWRTSVQRLSGHRFLILADGEVVSGGSPANARAARVVEVLDLARFEGAFQAALTAGGPVELGAGARIETAGQSESGVLGSCPADASRPSGPALALGQPDRLVVRPGSAIGGEPIWVDWLDELGLFRSPVPNGPAWGEAAILADVEAAGVLRPGPRYRADACDRTHGANWGAPLDPSGPCGTYFPLVVSTGDLAIDGGEGQGVLLVDGDLVIRGPFRFHGAILVRGALRMGDEARVTGAALASPDGGSIVEIDGAYLRHEPCTVVEAIRHSPGLNRALPPPGRSWIVLF